MRNLRVDVDLTTMTVTEEEISSEIREQYIGGTGINTKILFESDAASHDALSEKNVLIFGAGAAVGTGLPAGNRCTITARSPVTDMYGDSNAGGTFSSRMRAVGIDHLVISGRAVAPVYIHIDRNRRVDILDATALWGTLTHEVTEILKEKHGKDCDVACIGPAGENLVRFASVVMSKCHVAGRTGMGCVMGSKMLKAIVIDSAVMRLPGCDEERIRQLSTLWTDCIRSSAIAKHGSTQGTLMLFDKYHKQGRIPVRNCQSGTDDRMGNLLPEKLISSLETKRKSCIFCPVGCAKEYKISEGTYEGETGDRLDYGAAVSVGPVVGIFDWPSIVHLKMLTDHLGMDVIELGCTVAFLIECQQRGILGKECTGGKPLEFGKAEDVEKIARMIAYREGLGNLGAEGAYRAARTLNAESYAFCIRKSSSGLHVNSHLAYSLSHITSTRGGDHLKGHVFSAMFHGFFSELVSQHVFRMPAERYLSMPEGKGRVVWWHENYKYVIDSLGLCLFLVQALPSNGVALYQDMADVIRALYGLDVDGTDVLHAAERIFQMQNAFNVTCGLTLGDYRWPERPKDENISQDYIDATTITVRDEPGMLPEYFQYRGLTPDGRPTVKRFMELGLAEYSDRAEAADESSVRAIEDLLEEVNIDYHLTVGERLKTRILNSVVSSLVEKRYAKARGIKGKKGRLH